MNEIFSYTDVSGATLRVNEFDDGRLRFPRPHQSPLLNREAAKALWLALGEWLHPDAGSAPLPYANQSLIEQLIERAVKDQVAAALPLHRAPVALPVCDRIVPVGSRRGAACTACGYMLDLHRLTDPEGDPEPHDVGHADEPVARCDGTACCTPHPLDPEPAQPHPTEDEWAQAPGRRIGNDGVPLPYCKESYGGCGHSWGQHTGEGCRARNFDLSNRAHNPCGCTASAP